MSTFTRRKIRSRPPRKPLSEKAKRNIVTGLGIILIILFAYYGSLRIIDAVSGTRLLRFISGTFGKELRADAQGYTNILLIGIGGEAHEGKDLTDTLIIASINPKINKTAMMSVPRDLYVESSLGAVRINRLYEKGKLKWDSEIGLDFVRSTIENLLEIPIHYVVKVDFEAFVEVVDGVDGIDVVVEETIDDPFYPKEETYDFEPFYLEKGPQRLDGETALKYVRSRKTSSDFDRSRRQQQVLAALKQRAQEKNIFSRPNFIRQMYYSLEEHFETNMSLREMLTLAEFASGINTAEIGTMTLNDEPSFKGGFLYTPLRELYGGAFVLLPAGDNFDMIKKLVKIVFYGPKNISGAKIAVLNGTKQSGLASKARSALYRFGIEASHVGNAKQQTLSTTTWYVGAQPEAQELLPLLQDLIPGVSINAMPPEYQQDPEIADSALILELGEDSKSVLQKLDIFRNVVQLTPTQPAQPTQLAQPAAPLEPAQPNAQ